MHRGNEIEISKKKIMLATSLEKSKTTHTAKKINLIILWSELWDAELPGLDWSHYYISNSLLNFKSFLLQDSIHKMQF